MERTYVEVRKSLPFRHGNFPHCRTIFSSRQSFYWNSVFSMYCKYAQGQYLSKNANSDVFYRGCYLLQNLHVSRWRDNKVLYLIGIINGQSTVSEKNKVSPIGRILHIEIVIQDPIMYDRCLLNALFAMPKRSPNNYDPASHSSTSTPKFYINLKFGYWERG